MDLAQTFRGRKVLITGDTGFKGSWLALWLCRLGAEVVGYALPARSALDNYEVCRIGERIVHIDGDVCDYERLADVVRTHRPELVFHLAAQALVLAGYAAPRSNFATNIMGTVNILDALRDVPSVKVAVVVTSDKCYDIRDDSINHREGDPLGGRDPYSASKAAAEIVTTAMRASYFATAGAAVATVRAGNVIGAGDWAPDRLVPDCVRALRDRKPIRVRQPAAVRPWQHVLDAVHGYLMLAARLETDRSFASAWNFGPQSSESVGDLVDILLAAWGSGERVSDVDANAPAEAVALRLDSTKAHEQLGWRPALDFRRAIEWTVAGYRVETETPEKTFDHRMQQIRDLEERASG